MELTKLRFLNENNEPYPDWEEKRLGEVGKLKNGYAFKSSEYSSEGDYKVITIKNVSGNRYVDTNDTSKIKHVPNDLSPHQLLEIDDILISLTGNVGRVSIVNEQNLLMNQRVGLFEIESSKTDKLFITEILSSDIFEDTMSNSSQGGAQKNISKKDVESYPIPLPSLPEQEKIASFLSALDDRIEAYSALLDLSREEKKAYSQRLFSRSLRFTQDDGSPYPDWEEKKLGDLVKKGAIIMGRGKVISKSDIMKIQGDYPIYSSSALNNGQMGSYGKYMFDDERISWSVDGGGKFFYRPKHKYSVTNVSGWMKVVEEELINTRFLAQNLDFLWGFEKFDYSHKAHPSVINEIYRVSIPSLPEQEKIASFLSALDDRIENLTLKVEALKQEKKAYSQRMLG